MNASIVVVVHCKTLKIFHYAGSFACENRGGDGFCAACWRTSFQIRAKQTTVPCSITCTRCLFLVRLASLIVFNVAIVDDDDEILLTLAEALGQLVPAVGGPIHACLLLPR